jgi:hypothetical protein
MLPILNSRKLAPLAGEQIKHCFVVAMRLSPDHELIPIHGLMVLVDKPVAQEAKVFSELAKSNNFVPFISKSAVGFRLSDSSLPPFPTIARSPVAG